MTLTAKQRQFRGLLIGDGTDIGIVAEDGLEGVEVRDGDRAIPRGDGSIPGLHRAESKVVTLELVARGADPDAAAADVLAAFQPSQTTQFQYRFVNLRGVESFVWARPLRVSIERTNETEHSSHRPIKAQLKVADPRIYSVEQHSVLVPVFSTSGGGFDLEADLPINMTAAAQQTATAHNAGFDDAYPIFTVQVNSGTLTELEITNQTNGDTVNVATSVTAGQQLTLDFDALIRATGDPVIHIAGSSRYGSWTHPRDPFRLSPGDNVIRLEATDTTDVSTVLRWRDTD